MFDRRSIAVMPRPDLEVVVVEVAFDPLHILDARTCEAWRVDSHRPLIMAYVLGRVVERK